MTKPSTAQAKFLNAEQAVTCQVDAVFGGMYRVALFVNGSLVNRRRDVAPERIEAVKAALLKIEGLSS